MGRVGLRHTLVACWAKCLHGGGSVPLRGRLPDSPCRWALGLRDTTACALAAPRCMERSSAGVAAGDAGSRLARPRAFVLSGPSRSGASADSALKQLSNLAQSVVVGSGQERDHQADLGGPAFARALTDRMLPVLIPVGGTAECPSSCFADPALELDDDRIAIERVDDQQVLSISLRRDPFDFTFRTVGIQQISHLPKRRSAFADLNEAQVLRREPEFGRRISS